MGIHMSILSVDLETCMVSTLISCAYSLQWGPADHFNYLTLTLQLCWCRSWRQKTALRVWGHLKKRDNPHSLDDDFMRVLPINRLHLISCIACSLSTLTAAACCHAHQGVSTNATSTESAMSHRCEEKNRSCTAREFCSTTICEEETQPKLLMTVFFMLTAQGLTCHVDRLSWDAP